MISRKLDEWVPTKEQIAIQLRDGLREFTPFTQWDHGYRVAIQHAIEIIEGKRRYRATYDTVRIWLRKKT